MSVEQRSEHTVGGYLVVEPGCSVLEQIAYNDFVAVFDDTISNPNIDSCYKVYFSVWCGLVPPVYIVFDYLPTEEELDVYMGALLTYVVTILDDGFDAEHWELLPEKLFAGKYIRYGY